MAQLPVSKAQVPGARWVSLLVVDMWMWNRCTGVCRIFLLFQSIRLFYCYFKPSQVSSTCDVCECVCVWGGGDMWRGRSKGRGSIECFVCVLRGAVHVTFLPLWCTYRTWACCDGKGIQWVFWCFSEVHCKISRNFPCRLHTGDWICGQIWEETIRLWHQRVEPIAHVWWNCWWDGDNCSVSPPLLTV